jgi:hypothetical protein
MGGTDVQRAGADGSMSVKCSHSQSFLVFLTEFFYLFFILFINSFELLLLYPTTFTYS